MHVEDTEELGLSGDGHVFHIINAVDDGLASELLHLDVVELSEVTEPLDQLWRDAAVELNTGDIRQMNADVKELQKHHPYVDSYSHNYKYSGTR